MSTITTQDGTQIYYNDCVIRDGMVKARGPSPHNLGGSHEQGSP